MKNTLKTIILIFVSSLVLTGCTSSDPNSLELRDFTMEEVSKSNTKDDCKLVIRGKVYNVTEYVNSHPGGNEILNGCGKDATALFTGLNSDGREHSEVAERALERYLVGNLAN